MNETSPVQICKLPSLASRGHAVMYLASWARCPTAPGWRGLHQPSLPSWTWPRPPCWW